MALFEEKSNERRSTRTRGKLYRPVATWIISET